MYAILVYDISVEDKGPKILRNVFKICKKYMTHIQDSVFEGELSESQIFRLRGELKKHLRNNLDSCIIFKSRNEKWLDKEFWGREDDATSNFL